MVKFSFILAFVVLGVIASAYAECQGDANASTSNCESACPLTCANRRPPKIKCAQRCDDPLGYCVCNSGFVKGPGGKCVRPNQC
ncbi:trypsin inhibitor like cysteine rich domain-containing protein [Phthorimaea operculella]|nr:trypsin inhibitor like cysteine rich domain-containing protein [Phthorimaea operculella]